MRRLILTSLSRAVLFGSALTLLLSAAPAAAQTPTPTLRLDGYPAPGASPTITLISSGSDPKTQIRNVPTALRKEHMDVTMKMVMSIEAAGASMPEIPIPAMTMGMDLAVTEIKPNGEVTASIAMTGIALTEPNPDPMVQQMLGPMSEQFKSMKGTITFDARGQVTSQNIDFGKLQAPPGMDSLQSSLGDSIKNLAPPMPEAPLGVGARWEVRQAIVSNGMVTFQKTLNEITAMDRESITTRSTIEQTTPAQAMVNPALPPGAEMRIESGTATGSGTGTIRFGELVPSADVNIKTTMKMTVTANGQTVPMTMTMSIGTKISGKTIK